MKRHALGLGLGLLVVGSATAAVTNSVMLTCATRDDTVASGGAQNLQDITSGTSGNNTVSDGWNFSHLPADGDEDIECVWIVPTNFNSATTPKVRIMGWSNHGPYVHPDH